MGFHLKKIRLQKLLIDGADFYTKCKGWKNYQKEKHCRSCLVTLRKHDDVTLWKGKKVFKIPSWSIIKNIRWYTPNDELSNYLKNWVRKTLWEMFDIGYGSGLKHSLDGVVKI